MATFEGRGKCDRCARGVDFYSNKNGLAYYNCGPCGFRGIDTNRRTSDAALAKLDRSAIQEDSPAPEPTAAPAPTPTRRPSASPAPTATPSPAPSPAPARAGWFNLG